MTWCKNECFRRDVPRCIVCEEDLPRDSDRYACDECAAREAEMDE